MVWDDHGNSYIDAMASLWYCQVGHGRNEIIDAVGAQMKQLEAYNTFAPFTNEPAEAISETVAELSPLPDGRVFLCCSGSEAVDSALKIVRLWHRLRGDNHRQVVIKRTNGYHGTNFGGTSAQGIAGNREGWGDLVPHFVEVAHDDIEEAAVAFAANAGKVAAVITEPIQGAGGVWPPPEGYMTGLRRLCDDHGALLISDEVICGFGRTGEWFGAQYYEYQPDLITFAKAVTSGYLPLAGVILSRQICEAMESEPGFVLKTGYTYSGHPTPCAAGVANLRVMKEEDLLSRVPAIGTQLETGLRAMYEDGLMEGYRGAGGVWAAELGRDAIGVRDRLMDKGVITRAIGTALAICPPLVINENEITQVIDSLAAVLQESA